MPVSVTKAVEAPDLGGRYSSGNLSLTGIQAVEALRLAGRYSFGSDFSRVRTAVEAPDLGDRYSALSFPIRGW